MKKSYLFLALLAFGCKPIQPNADVLVEETKAGEEVSADELAPSKEKGVYHPSRTVLTDLINTKLEVSFDWSKSWMMGKETLTARPHFRPSNQLILDAKGMEIKSVSMGGAAIPFKYENDVLDITLNKTYTRTDSFVVVIDYIAKPDERATGGSAAITSDKGLYFINPTGKDGAKMPQIWTQGETESNSVWFPTIDSPNMKSKEEIYITVDDKYITLSNGKLVKSTKNANGTRTDYWKQDLAHAPYLFMMAVGEFKVVKDTWKRPNGTQMEVNYYVEPEWEGSAKAIFGETPAMIGFFSELLGVEYQWDKYNQIIVRDYVSGAMENTGAVIFGDYAYKNARELLDGDDNSTIAHELFHHWFGDLVTAESWSNLSLNESFANYSQYLWDEHRYGIDEADFNAVEETEGYYASAEQAGYHDLIWFEYNSREDMFDGHSYNKGGRILHMLRNYLGDEVFFKSLQLYLKTNSFKAAEYNQLRIAFEQVSGEDLNWFFNQWYLASGHPTLNVRFENNTAEKEVTLNVVQDLSGNFGVFDLPVKIAVYDDRGETIESIRINTADQTFTFKYVGELKNAVFDYQAMLLAKIKEDKPVEWYVHQFYNAKRYRHRKMALTNGATAKTLEAEQLVLDALKDPFWEIRETAIDKSKQLSGDKLAQANMNIKQLVSKDPKSSVRAASVEYLATTMSEFEAKTMLEGRISKDSSYNVISTALGQLSMIDAKMAMKLAAPLENEKSSKMLSGIAALYARSGTIDQFGFYEKAFNSNVLQGYDKLGALNAFTYYTSRLEPNQQMKALPVFEKECKTGGFYAQMFMPQYLGYLTENLSNKLGGYDAEIEKAKKDGNTNQADIVRGKKSDAEAVIKEIARIQETIKK